jgi:flagellar hook protein FlgE
MIATMSGDLVLATAISGLQANAARFGVAANNIVNANSDNYTAQSLNQTSELPGGVSTDVTQTDQPVDLAQEFVGMIEAQNGYSANAEVVDTSSRMTGTLLNMLA